MDETRHLHLPYIAAAQAQKHVTHNEALDRIDAIVQLSVLDSSLADPPVSPAEGDRYIVATGATGAWSGRDGSIAAFVAGDWSFIDPSPGWIAFDAAAGAVLIRVAEAWEAMGSLLGPVTRFGVNTIADDTNRLAVRSEAVLFSPIAAGDGGTGDMRVMVSKETESDTASLLFQSAFSGRAEMGLAGDDSLVIKVSDDGTGWIEAVRIETTSGVPEILYDNAASGLAATTLGGAIDELAASAREVLTASRTYYVRADGSDGNDGRSNTSGGAFLTIGRAIAAAQAIDWGVYRVTIQVGAGTYNITNTIAGPFISGQSLLILGNTGSPSNVVLTGGGNGFSVGGGPSIEFSGVTFAATGFCAVHTRAGGTIRIGPSCRFGGAPTFAQAYAVLGGYIEMFENFEVVASGGGMLRAEFNGVIEGRAGAKTITLTGTPAWSVAFAFAATGGVIVFPTKTFSGAATGKRFDAQNGGMIFTNGGGASYFPGDVAGTGSNLGTSPYGSYS